MAESTKSRPPSRSTRIAAFLAVLFSLLAAVGLFMAPLPDSSSAPEHSDSPRRDAVLNDATHLVNYGKFERAASLAAEAAKQWPEDHRAHRIAADAFLGLGQLDTAYRHLETALRLNPLDAAGQLQAGIVAERSGRIEQAVEHYRAATDAAPNELKHYAYLANALLAAGEQGKAEQVTDRLTQLAPASPEVPALAGRLAEYRGEHRLAAHHALAALERVEPEDSRYGGYLLTAVRALRLDARVEDALQLARTLDIERQREDDAATEISACLIARGDAMKAAGVWFDKFALEPGSALAAAEAGRCLLIAGDAEAATAQLAAARAIRPEHPSVLNLARELDAIRTK